MSKVTKFTRFIFLILLVATSIISFNLAREEYTPSSPQDATITSDAIQSRSGASTYATGVYDVDYSFLKSLCDKLGVAMDYDGFQKVIERFFVPFNIRFLGIWNAYWQEHANTTTTDIRFNPALDNFLSACDKYGIVVILWLGSGQWGASTYGWDVDVLKEFPELQTYDRSGNPVTPPGPSPFKIDHPLLLEQYKEDLKQLYEYYGRHPSWVGLGAFLGDYARYVGPSDSPGHIVNTGYSPFTIRNYVNSIYFQRVVDINTGLHSDGTKCRLYDMFVEIKPSVAMGYGALQDSDPVDVYGGTKADGRAVGMKFKAPMNLDGFRIMWYGRKVGSPPNPLVVELYKNQGPYDGDHPANLGMPTEAYEVSVTGIGWQGPIAFNTTLTNGEYYWLIFQTNGGDSNNKYQVSRRLRKYDESTFKSTQNGYASGWSYSGNAILKMQDNNGNDKKVYPYQKMGILTNTGSDLKQTLTPSKNITFNTVFLLTADRKYNEAPTTVEIRRVSDNALLTSGTFTQSTFKGLPYVGFVPISLDSRVTLLAGVEYNIVLKRIIGIGWQLYSLITDPPTEGFQGQSRTFIFKLVDMDIALENFMHVGYPEEVGRESGTAGVTDKEWYAIRFKPTTSSQLSNVSIRIQEKYGNPTDLVVALYNGTETQPSNELESKIFPATDVPIGWLDVKDWASVLTGNAYYWIVLKMASLSPNSGYRPSRVINPYRFMNLWTTDGGRTWKEPLEVMDIICQISTYDERFAIELDQRIDLQITDVNWVAQSFAVPLNTTVRGFLLDISKPPSDMGSDLTIELRPDNGTDGPSRTILASGMLQYTDINAHGVDHMDFDLPVALAANTKYWVILKSTKGSRLGSSVYVFRFPEYSYGGTAYHAKYSTNGGSTWTLPNGKDGDIIFGITQAPYPIKAYKIPDLAADIETYHYKKNTDEPLWGWNTYLNLQCSKILRDMLEWFEGYTGKKWIGLDVNTYRMIKEVNGQKYLYKTAAVTGPLPPTVPDDKLFVNDVLRKVQAMLRQRSTGFLPEGSLGHPHDNTGAITPEQIGYYYKMTVPILARGIHLFDVFSTNLMDENQQKWSRFYGQILDRMRYYGGWYGQEKRAVRALFIGDMDVGISPQFLTPGLDITLCGFEGIKGDYNLTEYGDFSQFDVITWISERPSMSQITVNAQERIKAFVRNGGGFVVVSGWADWANEVLGFDYTNESITAGTIEYIDYAHPILRPYDDISAYIYYWRGRKIVPMPASGRYIVRDTNQLPWISENTYGSGRAVFCGITRSNLGKIGTDPEIFGAPRESWLVLLSNAVFYAAKREDTIPAWYYENAYKSEHAWHEEVWYSICGKPGSPVLIWLSNDGETTEFTIHLNANFFGIDSNGWIAIDVQNWQVVAKGSGKNIKIDTNIPAKSWKPIYVMNSTSNLYDLPQLASPFIPKVDSTLNGWHKDSIYEFLYLKGNRETSLPIYEGYLYLIPIATVVIITTIEVQTRTKSRCLL